MDDAIKLFKSQITVCMEDLVDPRLVNCCDHSLFNILAIALLAVTCGGDEWTDLETFGKKRKDWLDTFLDMPNGPPSHDTFRRVFGLLERDAFAACLFRWTQALHEATRGDIIAIDGKALRRSPRRER